MYFIFRITADIKMEVNIMNVSAFLDGSLKINASSSSPFFNPPAFWLMSSAANLVFYITPILFLVGLGLEFDIFCDNFTLVLSI